MPAPFPQFLAFVRCGATSHLALLICGAGILIVAGCSSASVSFPPDGPGTGGVVVFDADGDGELGGGDSPVVGATIERLGYRAESRPRLTPSTPSSTTDDGGGFVLPTTQLVSADEPGVQVGLVVPLENGRGEGVVHVRSQLTPDTMGNMVMVSNLPLRCAGDIDADGLPLIECPTLALPDLMPIVERDQIDQPLRGESVDPTVTERASGQSTGLLPSETWFVDETDGSRRLLRFASLTANVGDGVLDVIAEPGALESQQSWQRIWGSDLTFVDRLAGEFVYHQGHAHMHFDEFEQYRLLDPSGVVVAEASKVSFCLRDSIPVRIAAPGQLGVFLTSADQCGTQQQSINVGWGDHYNQLLPDQWIDITDVAAGQYTVEIIVDPGDHILESDESNNTATFVVTIPER